jgi:hypothetical protein
MATVTFTCFIQYVRATLVGPYLKPIAIQHLTQALLLSATIITARAIILFQEDTFLWSTLVLPGLC